MKRIVVFCGSSAGHDPVYMEAATLLGASLAQRGITLVYGGAKVGLMGAVADGALQAGGQVIGVLPYFLQEKELAHTGLTELILVDTMHERKTRMNELSDGVIALPGGFGTMEELFEMLTWGQLGLHQKPIGLLNVNSFYDSLIQLAQTMTEKGFLSPENRDMLLCSNDAATLLTQMEQYQAPVKGKWITPAQS
ncbi:TIGR00730 family Rossman fold protein [Chitinophaga nivalis]|uniref:Cytokinin riboside 5'-monophosphate phosphoribohydrolase n=1 Tax=Chitinophaga nivalis TaxID=2991709 RepID=A0ABT3IRH9_9BACT|nr:TIGR00730 family Rossman fold protein [Chitinophaga nivalis]MCW3463736.1 TIGR00730 family Rossman fold protein [Chitinophaga nivalis]MCW3486574.1 TIGR00730 family Rossman fold protein [Chitinophaga nivalis]